MTEDKALDGAIFLKERERVTSIIFFYHPFFGW